MRAHHDLRAAVPKELLERRKRAFMAALTVQGETQLSWSARHKIDQSDVSKTLAGRIFNARILGLIYIEIERTSVQRVAQGLV